ncbi:hypothetical protein FRC11_005957 [Ceratobasidium sp. 423]|nr:hypothetical protein FRC11_005957 [Ceratobasidium sp. 423]
MTTSLQKSFLGIPQVPFSDESDDEPDPEDEASMHAGRLLVAHGPHIQPAMPTSTAHFSPNTPEHNASSSEANSAHASASVAANTQVDLPLVENGQLQHSLTRGSAIVPGNPPALDTGIQSVPSGGTAFMQGANTVASQDHAGDLSEQSAPASRVQESDSKSGDSAH